MAIGQLKLALKGNVWYIDGGWQTLVDGAAAPGVGRGRDCSDRNSSHIRVRQRGWGYHRPGGRRDRPVLERRLSPFHPERPFKFWVSTQNRRWPGGVAAACPSRRRVWMSRLPADPPRRFALGLDRPYYFSVHSAAARLAPEGISVVHVMKYLREGTDWGWGH